jgi:hypothetical protein
MSESAKDVEVVELTDATTPAKAGKPAAVTGNSGKKLKQGSILQNSFSAEKFLDKFLS